MHRKKHASVIQFATPLDLENNSHDRPEVSLVDSQRMHIHSQALGSHLCKVKVILVQRYATFVQHYTTLYLYNVM